MVAFGTIDMVAMNYDLFVDGEIRASRGDERIPVEYAYDREVWVTVPDETAADVDAPVARVARRSIPGMPPNSHLAR